MNNVDEEKTFVPLSYNEMPSSLRVSYLIPEFTDKVHQEKYNDALKMLRGIKANMDQFTATTDGNFQELNDAYSKMEVYLSGRLTGSKEHLKIFLKELSKSGITIR